MAWTSSQITSIANRVFFFLIVFQIPLFRIPCRSGICTTPLEVTSSQLITSEVFPPAVVKTLLFPGAIVRGLISNKGFPTWDNILKTYNLTDAKSASPMVELQRLEVLAGSYFTVAGSLVGMLKPGRMSLFGTLLIVWGLVKEGFLNKPAIVDPATAVYVYPSIILALVCAFSSIKYKVNNVSRGRQAQPVGKPLQSSSKSKLK